MEQVIIKPKPAVLTVASKRTSEEVSVSAL